MEISGKIIAILPAQSGTSAKGSWKKQEFVVEIPGQFPKKICFINWNDKVILDNLLNTDVKVLFDVESRENQGRWYTEAKVWRLETQGAAPAETYQPPVENPEDEGLDDLPF